MLNAPWYDWNNLFKTYNQIAFSNFIIKFQLFMRNTEAQLCCEFSSKLVFNVGNPWLHETTSLLLKNEAKLLIGIINWLYSWIFELLQRHCDRGFRRDLHKVTNALSAYQQLYWSQFSLILFFQHTFLLPTKWKNFKRSHSNKRWHPQRWNDDILFNTHSDQL